MTRIEILHYRDPDYECALTVFLDGVEVSAYVESVDPGAGYTEADWQARIDHTERGGGLPGAPLSDAFREALLKVLDENADSKWNLP